MTTDLVKSISVENLLQKRAAVVERITKAHALLQEVGTLADSIFGEQHTFRAITLQCCFDRSKRFTEADDLTYFVKQYDAALWSMLLKESGLRTFMDATARSKWDADIDSCNVPALTRENINATFSNLYNDRGLMFERGVVAVFGSLSWDYKTNNPVKFGKRIINRRVVWSCGGKVMGVDSEGASKVDDLLRVMAVLDGNAHITFLRPDLVDLMNKIVAKHHPSALPPARETT